MEKLIQTTLRNNVSRWILVFIAAFLAGIALATWLKGCGSGVRISREYIKSVKDSLIVDSTALKLQAARFRLADLRRSASERILRDSLQSKDQKINFLTDFINKQPEPTVSKVIVNEYIDDCASRDSLCHDLVDTLTEKVKARDKELTFRDSLLIRERRRTLDLAIKAAATLPKQKKRNNILWKIGVAAAFILGTRVR